MCFGSKSTPDDNIPARPAQPKPAVKSESTEQAQGSQSAIMSQPGSHNPYSNPQSSDYAPPSGPPPGHYQPPSGPPPGSRPDAEHTTSSGPPLGGDWWEGGSQAQGQQQQQYAPPPGPPPGNYRHDYAPPQGPPPSNRGNDYAPPSGPPPGYQDGYAPPPGPPPSHSTQPIDYAPPPGPPPPHHDDWIAPPKDGQPGGSNQHDWEAAVPDTSLFPPPPALFSGFDKSPSTNAPEEESVAGQEWCEKFPLSQPITLDHAAKAALNAGNVRLIEPAGFNGKLNWLGPGLWEATTAHGSPDRCIISYPPLYVVNEHDPTRFGNPKTIYYEIRVRPKSRDISIAMGFTALPYPSFRMPGWHRGSLAIHGDDGHKYTNDTYGGKTFTDEFRREETYGVGMTFAPTGGPRPQVDVFFTRNGRRTGGWDIHEEIDLEQDGPVTGLEGFHDLSCAIGTYDAVDFEVIFDRSRWLYQDIS